LSENEQGIDDKSMIINIEGYDVIIDKEDCQRVIINGPWYIRKSRNNFYFNNKKEYLHRFLINAQVGYEVDHINLNIFDNRKSNLRICTGSENSMNKHKQSNNITGYKGVSYSISHKKYETRIKAGNKKIWLGYFNTPQEAYGAYCEAVKKYHGEFGRME
jgi:hypothetical protein